MPGLEDRGKRGSDSSLGCTLDRDLFHLERVDAFGPETSFVNGLTNRLARVAENPSQLLIPLAAGLTTGALLSAGARLGPVALRSFITTGLPYIMATGMAVDIGRRIVPLAIDALRNPDGNSFRLGDEVGSLAIDYTLMGLGGLAGATATSRAISRYSGSGVERNISAISESLLESYRAPRTAAGVPRAELASRLESVPRFDETNPLVAELEEGMAAVQTAFNRNTRTLGIPDVQVTWSRGQPHSAASHQSGTSAMEMNGFDWLTAGKKTNLSSAVHEFTHIEQDSLVVRRLADRMGIGANATDRQISQLFSEYSRASSLEPNGWYWHLIRDVLKVREGIALSPAEATRADTLMRESSLANTYMSELYDSMAAYKSLARQEAGASVLRAAKNDVLANYKRRYSLLDEREALFAESAFLWQTRLRNPGLLTLQSAGIGTPLCLAGNAIAPKHDEPTKMR